MLLLLFPAVLLWVMISAFEIPSAPAPSRSNRRRRPTLRRYPSSGNVRMDGSPRLPCWMSPLPSSEDGSTVSSSSVPFNPFQYDATSVRTSRNRIQTMSHLHHHHQSHNSSSNDGNVTLTDVSTLSSTGTTKLNTPNHRPNSYRISLRALTMKQIMNDMIQAAPDFDQVHHILQTNRDFLLEPLEDDTATMDDNSIYIPGTDRQQRYTIFSNELQTRIRQARNPSVQQILRHYHDFVMSHQS